jgi:hypothetical protein
MDCTPHWTAYISAVVVPIIALIAAWIAFRQSQIARNKLKLDLFEKRMAVYETVRKTLGTAASRGKLTPEEEVSYLAGIHPAQWLFGPEVFKYLDETLWHKITDLDLHNSMLKEPPGEERSKHVRERAETLTWLVAQLKEFDNLCRKYLMLKH